MSHELQVHVGRAVGYHSLKESADSRARVRRRRSDEAWRLNLGLSHGQHEIKSHHVLKAAREPLDRPLALLRVEKASGSIRKPALRTARWTSPQSAPLLLENTSVNQPSSLRTRAHSRAAAAVTLLVTHEAVEALTDQLSSDGPALAWALFGLGQLPPEIVESRVGERLTPELRAELTPLWTGEHRNWVRREDNTESLLLLAQQTVRYRPEDAS